MGAGAGGEEVKTNITDEESAKNKGAHGYIQGYKEIAVRDSEKEVIVVAEAFGSGSEREYVLEMMDRLSKTMKGLSGEEEPLKEAIGEGDRGYCTEKDLKAVAERGIPVLIPDQQFRKQDGHFDGWPEHGGKGGYTGEDFEYEETGNRYRCPAGKELMYKAESEQGEQYQAKSGDCKGCPLQPRCIAGRGGKNPKGTLYIVDRSGEENRWEKMRKKLDEVKYRALYGRRMQIREPCFSDMSCCKWMDSFSLRGKVKVNNQWLGYCIVHNIGKCIPRIAAGN
ncbi:MAG: transposase [Treponema sp.]|nr:transposase [Treponema sp.]